MKSTFLMLLLVACNVIAKSQNLKIPFDSATKKISYTEVVKSEGFNKDQLYVKAREWFAKTFNSAQNVIQMDDKQAGKIVGKATSRGVYTILLTNLYYTLNFTIIVSLKDARYKYEITDFFIKEDDSKSTKVFDGCIQSQECLNKKGNYKEPYKTVLEYINKVGIAYSENLKAVINQDTNFKSKDDF